MGKTIYIEAFSGISGDMTVAALLDLGANPERLKAELKTLPIGGFDVEISRVKKSGLDCCDFAVLLDEEVENHDHDNEYLYGHREKEHEHNHEDEHEDNPEVKAEDNHEVEAAHEHNHEEAHEHSHEGAQGHVHKHEHRGLKEVMEILEGASVAPGALKIAKKIFMILAQAEAKAHGTTLEDVHFHEVGAVDSIVDILSVAICLDDLDVSEVIIGELYEGCGTIHCQHGILPIPVPAVVNIVEQQGLKLHITNTEAELVTPTGAAIAAAIRTSDQLPEKYQIKNIGMGAGKREYKRTSVLRVMIIEAENSDDQGAADQSDSLEKSLDAEQECLPYETDEIIKLESNIDDCDGEVLGYTMDLLMKSGALDVNYTPIYMKKNRPAYQLNVICKEKDVELMEDIIFHETSTIGIRQMKMQRHILRRYSKEVETGLGKIDVKVSTYKGMKKVMPEYESVAEICREKNLPFAQTWELLQREAEKSE